ncbi:MAG: GAF domain-containing protein [Bryobacteraceae bacterium]|nr:GAF domain-containing protein [Bryobacteraceae bacterium]
MRELKAQFLGALLVILTVAVVICAGINFQEQSRFSRASDGAVWVDGEPSEDATIVHALRVAPDTPADKAGLRQGDILLKISGTPVVDAASVPKALVAIGAWNKAEYVFLRGGVEVKATVYLEEDVTDTAVYYQYLIGLAYLAIGIFVYFRRGNAPKAQHFYILCLASFVLSTFHYTGKLNNFDKVIYWGNVAAWLYAPTLFLHFALSFPEPRRWIKGFARSAALYLPATALLAVHVGFASKVLRIKGVSLLELRWMLDRIELAFLAGVYLAGAAAVTLAFRRAEDPVARQQLKWLRNGALYGVLPFALLYVIPYMLGAIPGPYMKLSVFSLMLIPLTWAYAVLRYRLMDVDVIFQQGYAYTLATLAVLGVFYGLVLSLGSAEEMSSSAVVLLILIATFVFQPIRNWIQEQLDRYYFYKDRYDYRRTLIEFARELRSETDLDAMLDSVAERLINTLSLQHVAFFLADDSEQRYYLEKAVGRPEEKLRPLDLSFLSSQPAKPYLFIERTRHPLDDASQDLPVSVRHTIAALDLTYYVPCTVRGRTIAYVGASRTTKGDFLSSDDLEILVTLSGYVGIAIENARLYQSLQNKVEQYERLKDFSENIVESINVGILAADLDDRVESWNSQIERLTGIPREAAVGRSLSQLFPAGLMKEFDSVRGESGVRNVYRFVLRHEEMPAEVRKPVLMAAGANGNGHGNGNGSGNPAASPAGETVLNIAIAPLVSKNREQIGRLVIFDDVTTRSQLEQQLVQADKLSSIGLLAAGVAHEVNTPLAVISTYAQMLARQVSGDDQKSRILEKIAKQTFRASEIVNSLLNFSRTSQTDFSELDLNRVIRETIALLEPQLEKVRVRVQQNLQDDLPRIRGNAGRLQQVFLNLFLNARDAMDEGGVLRIRTASSNGSATVDVADTGKGIPREALARIYDPFFTTKGPKKGTGLGLSVTYGIVREHGGTIEVESLPGAGTCFHLDFPVIGKTVSA